MGVSAASVVLWRAGALDANQLRTRVSDAGPAAPVLFALAYAGLTLLPVPKNVLSVAAGAGFGLGGGVGLVWVAAMAGAGLAFTVARLVDPSALSWVAGRHQDRVEQALHRRGLAAVVAVRLVPLAPFTAINYVCGMSTLRVRDYALGTGIGIVPGTVAYVAVGAYGIQSPGRLAAAGAAMVVLVVVGGVWARRPGTAGRGGER